jgi:RimJ/RimL family protein N-acetyltransferase
MGETEMGPVIDAGSGLPIGPEVDASPARRPERIRLAGRHVTLLPLSTSHAADIYEASHGPEKEKVWLYLFEPPFAGRDAFQTHIRDKANSPDPLFYAIIDNHSGRATGYATLMRIEPTHRVIEVGNILYAPAMQRTCGATEVIYLLARYVFDELGYRRFEWKCNDLNAPSKRAALRFGFTFEGIFRQHVIVKGRNRDTAWFAMLDAEWPARKAAFERWLAPSNFDTDGRQKLALSAINGVGLS